MLLPGSKNIVGGSISYFFTTSSIFLMIISAISYVEGGNSFSVYFTPKPPPILISLRFIPYFLSTLEISRAIISISSGNILVSNICEPT